MSVLEVNFDGLVGPTHNYAGLSYGNVASIANQAGMSRPREAALQGLAKMKALADLGVPQALLPPHERPDVAALRRLGFSGTDAAVLAAAKRQAPEQLAAVSSAAAMWTANAATVSPSADTADGRVHFTPANLACNFHRSLEAAQTERTLRAIFRDDRHFVVHAPLASSLGDEGAANHTRFCRNHGVRGLHFFVYGHDPRDSAAPRPAHFPARQSRAASEAIARSHLLLPPPPMDGFLRHGPRPGDQILGGEPAANAGRRDTAVVFGQQNPAAVDAGAFHNDVVAVGHRNVHFFHEDAFREGPATIARLDAAYARLTGQSLLSIGVPAARVSLDEAIRSYLFNSQLVTLADGAMALIAPAECNRSPVVKAFLDELVARADTPIRRVFFFDLHQSMRNGGGPACLRLRVVLTAAELAAMAPGIRLTETTQAALVAWVHRHYRDELRFDDLADPRLLDESRRALDELTVLLGLGAIYPFQRA